MDDTLYIVNPAGLGGSGVKAWDAFQAAWPEPIAPEQVVFTERPGHAREIAESTRGHGIYAAVGGDGTVGEVMSGISDRPGPGSRPRLAIVPAGTGNDMARNLGIVSVQDAVTALRQGREREVDLVRVESQVGDRRAHQYAFLFCAVGFSAIPMMKPWMKRLLGPRGAYYLATLSQAIVYKAPEMAVRTEEQEISGRLWVVVVGNAEYSAGGSMRLAPGARIDDGELDVTVIPSGSKFKLIPGLMPKIASGAHVTEPGVSYFRARRIEIDSDPPAVVDLDGDLFGTTPAVITVCPGILRVMAPASAAAASC